MKTTAIVLAALAGTALAATPAQPVFANDWTGVTAQHIVVNQGGVTNADGSVTCPAQAAQCKVQTGFQGAKQYVSVTQQMQKIAAADNSGIVVDIKAGKEYQVDSTNTCTGYCPLPKDNGPIEPLSLFPNSTYSDATGNQWCNGKTPCSAWTSYQRPMFNVTFETDTFYVSGDTPLAIYESLTPFGMPMGFQSTQFMTYSPGAIDPSVFAVKGVDNTSTCVLLQCNSGNDDGNGGNSGSDDQAKRAVGSRSMLATQLPTFSNKASIAAAFKVAAAENPAAAEEFLATFPADHPVREAF